jgi:hypothetical protein
METLNICIKEMVDALKEQEAVKDDCKMRIDAAYATLMESDETVKKLKIKKKVLQKMADSIVKEKISEFSDDNANTAILIEKVFGTVNKIEGE